MRTSDGLRPQTRVLLAAFTVLTVLAVVSLVGGAGQTDRTFAWTIQPPATAAFLGAGYASGTALVALSLRSGRWGVTRVPLAVIGVFTALTLLATLVHLDRFHLGADGLPRAAAWLWLAVYVVVPLWIAATLVLQGAPTPDGLRRPLPGPLRATLAVQGTLLGGVGALLYLVPAAAERVWPWTLTPLTARAVGSWLLAYAAAAALLVRADRLDRMAVPGVAYAVLGAGTLAVALLAEGADLAGAPGAVYVVVAASVLVTGVVTALAARRGEVS